MEVNFVGKTFELIDELIGEISTIVVFVAVLSYSQYIYTEGMISTCELQCTDVNNYALDYFGSVPAIVVCDSCKQAVATNKDWINPDLNKDYEAWLIITIPLYYPPRYATQNGKEALKML